MWVEVIIILLLFLLNGVFSMAEIAIVSARKVRLEGMAKKGSKGAKAALELSADPTRFLSTVQVGITLIGVLTGFYSGSVFSDNVAAWLASVGIPPNYTAGMAVGLVLLVTTYLSLVLGELVPKKIGLLSPERIAAGAALPMAWVSRISAPAVLLLTASTNFIIRIFRLKPSNDAEVTEEEVKSLIAQGASTGTFEKIEQSLVERVFHFSDRNVGSLMTNRTEVAWVDVTDPTEALVEELKTTRHSHLLLCNGSLDEVQGVLNVRQAITYLLNHPGQHLALDALAAKPMYVPDSMGVLRMVEKLREKRQHLAIVVNEFGAVQGVITQTDVFDGLLNDAQLNTDEGERTIVKRPDGSYLIDGTLPYADFLAFFDLDDEAEPVGFYTLAGLFLAQFKQIPQVGDAIEWRNIRLEVIDLDGKRIDKILLTPPAQDLSAEDA